MEKIKEDTKINPEFESQCEICFWYAGNKRCPAFIKEIPNEIWNGIHNKIFKEQVLKVKFTKKGELI